ncbi:hypothetical protein Tco_1202436 [Tanacetum coccineum]
MDQDHWYPLGWYFLDKGSRGLKYHREAINSSSNHEQSHCFKKWYELLYPAVSSDVVSKKNGSSIDFSISINHNPAPASVISIREKWNFAKGGPPYQNCPAPFMDYRDNIQNYRFTSAAKKENEPEVTKDTVQPSTENIQPPVVQTHEPVAVPKTKPTLPYPSRANQEKFREKDDLLALKFMEIFRNLHFELSFADALLHMPKFAPMFRKHSNDKDKMIEVDKETDDERCLSLSDLSVQESTNALSIWKRIISSFLRFCVVDYVAISGSLKSLGRTFLEDRRVVDGIYDPEGDTVYLEELLSVINSDPNLLVPVCEITVLKKFKSYVKILRPRIKEFTHSHLDPWVSPGHVVLRRGGITVVKNEDHELIPTRWLRDGSLHRLPKKLKVATVKDHFPLPFMDQMLESISRKWSTSAFGRFSATFNILIEPIDQEEDHLHLPLRDICLSSHAFWFMQCTRHVPKVYDWTCPLKSCAMQGDFAVRGSPRATDVVPTEKEFFKDVKTLLLGRTISIQDLCRLSNWRCVSGQDKKLLTFLKLAHGPTGDNSCNYTAKKVFRIQDLYGPQSTRMPTTLSPVVTFVNVKAKFRNVMKCHKTLSKFAKSLTMWGGIDFMGPLFRLKE